MNRLKGVHFGSYWMGTNDVVYLMTLDLRDLCDLTIIDTGIYSGNARANNPFFQHEFIIAAKP